MKINIGCGTDIKSEYINIDTRKLHGVDVVCDAAYLPFKNNVFEAAYCNHVLEHTDDLNQVMEEIHGVLKSGGRVYGTVPYFTSHYAVQDPTHRRFISYFTFSHFAEDPRAIKAIKYSKATFIIRKRQLHLEHDTLFYPFYWFINKYPGFYERYLPYVIIAKSIYFEMEAVKI